MKSNLFILFEFRKGKSCNIDLKKETLSFRRCDTLAYILLEEAYRLLYEILTEAIAYNGC